MACRKNRVGNVGHNRDARAFSASAALHSVRRYSTCRQPECKLCRVHHPHNVHNLGHIALGRRLSMMQGSAVIRSALFPRAAGPHNHRQRRAIHRQNFSKRAFHNLQSVRCGVNDCPAGYQEALESDRRVKVYRSVPRSTPMLEINEVSNPLLALMWRNLAGTNRTIL